MVADLTSGRGSAGEAAGDTYVGIEGLRGSQFNDVLIGHGGDNTLIGYGGNDSLYGQGGHDYLVGGEGHDLLVGGWGADWLVGGAGADVFRLDAPGAGVDTLEDFAAGVDRIELDTRFFAGLAAPAAPEPGWSGEVYGGLKASAFGLGPSATTLSQRVIYDGATGGLFYDLDGSGAAAQVQIAQLAKGLALTAASFGTYSFGTYSFL